MKVDINRIMKDIEMIARFNSTPGCGCTRLSYSPQDHQARDYLVGELKTLNLEISVDGVGNIRARRPGTVPTAPAVLVGSHIDTVRNGGNFDGVLGTVAGLEALRVLTESDCIHSHPVELIVFAEEEGSGFHAPLAGSKALTGVFTEEDISKLQDDAGVSMYQAALDFGLDPGTMPEHVLRPGEIKAMLELHIEQSVVLESEELPVGIVENVAGCTWLGVTLRGTANHAGATPMGYRQDPLVGAAAIIAAIEELVSEKGTATTVATVGKVDCLPNTPNVIPGEVFFMVDVRDIYPDGIEVVSLAIEDKVSQVASARGLEWDLRIMVDTKPIQLSAGVVKQLENSARALGISFKRMNSGALHDACIMASITDVGMIFVPSVGGRSHAPQEFSKPEDIEQGCNVLLSTLAELAK